MNFIVFLACLALIEYFARLGEQLCYCLFPFEWSVVRIFVLWERNMLCVLEIVKLRWLWYEWKYFCLQINFYRTFDIPVDSFASNFKLKKKTQKINFKKICFILNVYLKRFNNYLRIWIIFLFTFIEYFYYGRTAFNSLRMIFHTVYYCREVSLHH